MSDSTPRGLLLGALAIAAAATIIAVIVIAPRVARIVIGVAAIHDAATIPDEIDLCGRSWTKDALERELTLTEIRERDRVEPVVVDPGPSAPCPAGPCARPARDGPCDTVIYVRVGWDAYVDYALQGGP